MTAPPAHQVYPSPLRYPGGKGKLANYMKVVMLENDLVGSEYVEIYAGGASVALALLFEDYAAHVHINDLNRSVFAFWNAVLDETDELCWLIEEARLDVDEWERQRAVQDQPDPDPIELAFSTFYLNRTNRSGIINGGIIGGRNQTGQWTIGARFNRTDLVRRIRRISRFRNRISLTQIDAAEYLREVAPSLPSPFLYLDPPYYVKGGGLYESAYGPGDHAEVAALVQNLDAPWVVTYDDVPEIQALYDGASQVRYNLSYTAHDRYRGSEVMFCSSKLRVPSLESPAKVGSAEVALARSAAVSTA